jgi:glutamyl-tRNA synthetase
MENSTVRVRFAPSPTGYLHLGSLRTALFNYLFARHNGGKFILRIEDTDQTRKLAGAVENLINTLQTMGLNYDEGPGVGGSYGPYFQSERLDIYKKYCNELLEHGHAYYAFETEDELEKMRQEQLKAGKQTMYDGRARNLASEAVKEKLASGEPYVVRLKIPMNTEIQFNDVIRGEVRFDTNLIDDQVLMKSDGFPTYHFANVIDDHLMEITHVIRGEEWLTSVPKHIILYKAFGWEIPKMAHVPLILNPDKSKLSKRQGDVATEDYLKKGYLKEAIINYMVLLGWNPGESVKHEIFSLNELTELFDINRVQSKPAIFDINKFNWMNGEYIRSYDIKKLTEFCFPFMKQSGLDVNDKDKAKRVVYVVRNKLSMLDEIGSHAEQFYREKLEYTAEQKKYLEKEPSKKLLKLLLTKTQQLSEITVDNYKPLLQEVQKETGLKGKELYMPIRLALVAEEHGPDLGLVAYALGKDKVEERLYGVH